MANKYPAQDLAGNHCIGGTLTGWLRTDANRHVACPRCGSTPGYLCETPKGRKATYPHPERCRIAVAMFGSHTWTITSASCYATRLGPGH